MNINNPAETKPTYDFFGWAEARQRLKPFRLNILTDWEMNFLNSISNIAERGKTLTQKQKEILRKIITKYNIDISILSGTNTRNEETQKIIEWEIIKET
jgi:hypothetical protein